MVGVGVTGTSVSKVTVPIGSRNRASLARIIGEAGVPLAWQKG